MKILLVLSLLFNLSALAEAKIYTSGAHKFSVKKLVSKEGVIWGMDFLPDRKLVFTMRSGKMFIYNPEDKKTSEVTGVPEVYAVGQGGLLDVRAHPDFSKNNYLYFTYSLPVGEKATTALARGVLKDNKLKNVEKLFSAHEPNDNDIHFGSRIAFHDGYVFISIGDRNERQQAQSLKYHMGKIIRLKDDGSIPKDNPFVQTAGALSEIWSYGHRNPQGLEYHVERKELWSVEFGPRGGDEVNIIKKGENYGWPLVSYGREYYGPKIGEGTHKEGITQPILHWTPAISPSGFTIYTGEEFPKWKGHLFLANLASRHLRRVVLEGTKSVKQEELLKDLDYRFRHVTQGPDGLIYFSTDEGILARLKKE